MNRMFMSAITFNGNISEWNVSMVVNMRRMFKNTTLFNQQLCGAAWVYSKANKKHMFVDSLGSISVTVCHLSSPQRWLARWQITRTRITTSTITTAVAMSAPMICTNCSTFKRSGQASCCAPGGAWYEKCGNSNNKNVDRSWLEGVEACKCKSTFYGCHCMLTHAHKILISVVFLSLCA